MKKILTTLFAISSIFLAAQTPSALGINYQSIIRNVGGTVMASTPVTVDFKLYSTATLTNVLLYHETHSTTTNSFGMANLVIGQGTVVGGAVTFNNIPWIGGIAYEVYVNSNMVGSRQSFVSVPYALASAYAPAPNVTFSNNVLSVGGNTVSITAGSTYTAGSDISIISGSVITNTAPDKTVSITGTGATTVSGTYPNFTINSPTISASVPPTIIGTGVSNVTSSANTFTVNTPMSTYNNATGVFATGTQTISVAPVLSLTGAVLQSGPSSNTVNISALNTWSISSGVLFPTILTNSVGIGTSGPLTDKMEINHPSSPTNTHLHLKQTGADAFSRIKYTNAIAPNKFWLSSVTSAASDANSGHNFFYHNGTAGHNIFTVAGDGRVSVNTFSTMGNAIMDINGALEIDSTFAVNAIANAPTSLSNSGKIYFDATANKFKVSENGGAYVDMIAGTSPWTQAAGSVTLTNSSDMVGIGSSAPVAALDINGNLRVNDKIFLGNVGGINTGYTGIYEESDDLKLAVFKPGAGPTTFGSAGNSIDALVVKSQTGYVGIGTTTPNASLDVVNNYTVGSALFVGIADSNNGSDAMQVTQNGLGKGGHFEINNSSNASPAIYGRTGGAGPVIIGDQFGTGRAADFRIYSSTNNQAVVFAQTGGLGTAGYFETFNTSSTNNAVTAATFGAGNAIFGNHLGATGHAGYFNIPGGSPNTSSTLFAANIASGNAIDAQAGTGSALNASNSSSVSATILASNSNGDVVFANSTRGRAYYGMNNGTSGLSTMELASNGDGSVIFAYKNNGAPSGNVAALSNNSPGNTSDAVLITDNGQGNGMRITKPSGTTSGNVAKFDNLSTGNSADAVFATNAGAGATIHTDNGSTAIGSNLGVLIENGHIGTTNASNLTAASSCACSAPSITMDAHSTDVAGTLRAVYSSTTGAVVDINVSFAKPYKKYPVVIVTPGAHPSFSYTQFIVTPIGVSGNYTGFKISVESGINSTAGPYVYNYMVIEGKN